MDYVYDFGSVGADQATFELELSGALQVNAIVSGTWSGTLLGEAATRQGDGTLTWDPVVSITPILGGRSLSFSANGTYVFVVAGYQRFRIRAHPWTSGTANIAAHGIANAYVFPEHYQLTVKSSAVVSATQQDVIDITNYLAKGIGLFLFFTAVTGAVPYPQVRVGRDFSGTFYNSMMNYTKAGNISANTVLGVLIYPGASGGLFDKVEPVPVSRNPRVLIDWTLAGGTSVTYSVTAQFYV